MNESANFGQPQWAILELLGHVRIAGKVSEVELFGAKMGRIDVPRSCTGVAANWCPVCGNCCCEEPTNLTDDGCPLHGQASKHGQDLFTTQYFGASSIYRLTPTTEEGARRVQRGNTAAPVHALQLPRPESGDDFDDTDVPY